jgi:hypothetical protein
MKTAGSPRVQRNPKNRYASATPATDGKHLVSWWPSVSCFATTSTGSFDRGAIAVNLEILGGVRVDARGNRAIQLSLTCGGGEFGKTVEASDEWRLIEIPASELRPIPESAQGRWSGTDCVGLYFSRRGAANVGDFWFEVDQVTFSGSISPAPSVFEHPMP